ncbi:hypothetical protein D3C85_1493190 [compost metagenome]
MTILLSFRASIARTFATRSCSWFIPERGSMPITIDLTCPAALAFRLAGCLHSMQRWCRHGGAQESSFSIHKRSYVCVNRYYF